jgi:hypothetical protein
MSRTAALLYLLLLAALLAGISIGLILSTLI